MFKADKYQQEPLLPLVVFFALGALVTIPAVQLEWWAMDTLDIAHNRSLLDNFLLAFVVVALWEEGLKMLILLGVYRRSFFDEPLDGIVYAVMVGMGFATMENIAYYERFGSETLWVRAFTAVPAHLVFAIIQGYFIGKARFREQGTLPSGKRLVGYGFGISLLLHGLYDVLIFNDRWQWLFVLATSSMYLCLFYCRDLIHIHLENSPFKHQHHPDDKA
jgi:protease PrsW